MFSIFLIFGTSIPKYCSPTYTEAITQDKYEREYVTILFKHGIHSPIDKIPGHDANWECSAKQILYPGKDAFDEQSNNNINVFRAVPISSQSFLKGTCQAGSLLDTGIDQMVSLAKYIKRTYSSILPNKYHKRAFNFRSTYTDRTMNCLEVIISHLYDELTPIELFVANEELESLVPNPYLCPELSKVLDIEKDESLEITKRIKEFNKKIENLKNESKIVAAPSWRRMGEMLSAHICNNAYLPPGFDEKLSNEATNLLVDYYKSVISDKQKVKYSSGLLLSDIYFGMRDYLTGMKQSKFALIAGHTLSIVSLELAFGLNTTFPAFGDFISIELLRKDQDRIVNIVQNGIIKKTMKLQEFIDFTLEMRPKESECKIQWPFAEKDKKDPGTEILSKSFS
ncbi:hypothetical protein TVAG_122830 [Trichomonas vaginalis G3]|uniref:Histidine acid phosphatase family protein n=1 Tax=Trichomonas vaginalis (strain ATCC PRA-98 / G3) TaxID=412133 RepID=A2DN40_TRIV3|nr:acid phosphatase protein [Trichomonas vaginalis G3]EAY18217.1 hypothetical protein TVAG_122830 [Trichomonas vaginalis G3]KAI5491522.1 acid phosphatase protein [Trichomonas vaginalis G3]|eukprot:XP_001579203.1 hypothetical protein [Trichomonas vaginalis G3]